MSVKVVTVAMLAVVCFAANSVLCRLALAPGLIDPASFTTIRVASAAAIMGLIVFASEGKPPRLAYASFRSVLALFVYLVLFSFAYMRLDAGTGALILFGAVQITMFGIALRDGERFPVLSWAGLLVAIGGVVYLVLPGVRAPDLLGAGMMAIAGVGWGFFSLFGRGLKRPVECNAVNFLWCLIPALLLNAAFAGEAVITISGVGLAVASGLVASGIGYAIWYFILPELSAMRAATLQLTVPAIAALGGALFLAEPLTLRLIIASAAMLGGTAIVLAQRSGSAAKP